jgi:hypothetical protein
MRRGRALAALGGVALLGLAACQLILGVKDEQGAPREAGAGSDDAAADARTSRCALLRPPAGGTPSSDTSGETFVFALRTLAVNPSDASLGFDLDGLCTGEGAEVPCLGSPADLAGGVDNQLAQDLGSYGYSPPPGVTDPPAEAINNELSQGKYSALLIVRSFNGTANDDHTVVSLIGSPGMERRCAEDPAGAPPQTKVPSDAAYEDGGCELWSLGPYDSIGAVIDKEPIAGRVVDGLLIAHFPTLAFQLGPLAFTLEDAILTARLSATGDGDASAGLSSDGGATADGLITGRARTSELIGALRQTTFLPLAGGGAPRPLCQQPPVLEEEIRSKVCKTRDVTLGDDPPSQRCRGISLALGFHAKHVQPGHKSLEVDAGPVCDASFDASCGTNE